MKKENRRKGSSDPMKLGMAVIFLVIGAIIAITALTNQAPTVSIATQTGAGTALANANVTSTSLAGTVYSFVNVFWALAVLGVVAAIAYGLYKKGAA